MHLKKLIVTGTDRQDFLNRQFSANIAAMTEGDECLTAWCNIQGRASTLCWLKLGANDITLHVPAETFHKLMPRLQMFVLRDDVKIAESADCWFAGAATEDGQFRLNTSLENNNFNWQGSLIENGIPYLTSDSCDEYLPQMLNLDQVQGLSFNKGCYPGQEIIARTHFRGRLKQRMLRLNVTAEIADEIVNADGAKVGSVMLSDANQCLAMVKLDAAKATLFSKDGQAAEIGDFPYAIPELASS